jgi:hypothetical protein
VIHLFLKMARKVDEAADFVFVQEPGIYDKRHPDCARQDKIDLTWGKKFLMRRMDLVCQVRVKVTLRLTVGQSVSLGVEPHLGHVTRYLLV